MKYNRIQSVLVLFVSIVLLTSSCQQKEKFDGYTITGNVKGLNNGLIKIYKTNIADRDAKPVILDSVQIQNGHFELKGKVDVVDQVNIQFGENHYSNFILENCEMKMNVIATVNKRGRGEVDLKVNGSKLNDMLAAQDAIEDSIFNQEKYAVLNELRAQMTKAYASKDKELIKKYQARYSKYETLNDERYAERKKIKMDYVKQHPTSILSPYVLNFQFSEGRMSREEMKEIYPIFKGAATQTAMYKYYTKTYKEIFERLAIGATAPDFTLPTNDGGTLTLSKVKGKYIFVDFWASWCGPCRASFPHLKKVYGKYHKDGFQVVAVGAADVESKWLKAIKKDKTVWNHVFDDGGGDHKYGKVSKLYAVPFLPTTFLLDENGKILGRQLRGDSLDKKMEELYGY